MGEINVVPYIDVMLVLLIIFMITAPLLAEGIKVELPKAGARRLPRRLWRSSWGNDHPATCRGKQSRLHHAAAGKESSPMRRALD
jgi:hypothetical protein